MGNKYAVVSGLWSDIATWSDSDGGGGGAAVPADGDAVFISAAVNVQMDTDLSGYTGLFEVTIRGGATPGMLYWKNGPGPVLRIGTTNTNVRTDSFSYLIGSTYYFRAAVAAGTALSGSNVPDGTYGAWALEIGANGTIDIIAATDNATGYGSASLAIAGLPAVAASHVRIGTVTAMNAGAVFIPGTTALDAGTVTEAYADIANATCSYGFLKIRTTYHLLGTTSTNRGRLLVNSDGTWRGTLGKGTVVTGSAADNTLTANSHALADTTLISFYPADTSAVLPAPLVSGKNYYVRDTATNTFKVALTSGGAAIDLTTDGSGTFTVNTCLAFINKAVIDLPVTGHIDASNLDISLNGTEPTNKYVRTYGQIFHEATVDATGNTLTYTGIAAALPNTTLVRVTAGSGALPAELAVDTDYWVVGATGNTIQLATTSGGGAINLSAGGPIQVHAGLYANWGVSGNTLTKTTHGLADATAVMVKSTGTLPTPLTADTLYYVVSTAAGSISLAAVSAGTVLTLGGSPSGTLDVYTGSTGAAPGLGGTNPYTSTMVKVLDDVSADTPWTTTDGHDHAVLADIGPVDYDQQRLQLTTITATAITLSAVVDSIQYPGARLYLSSRNISIRSACITYVYIIDYSNATTLGGIFQNEIRSTAGIGVGNTTFYGYGINAGTGQTVSGSISGCTNGINAGVGQTVSGSISGCTYGINAGVGQTVSGLISGCQYGINYGTGQTVNGLISGCTYGIYYGTGHIVNGLISGCQYGINGGIGHILNGLISGCSSGTNYGVGYIVSGSISGCTNGINYGVGYTVSGSISGCSSGINAGVGHTVSGLISGCTYDFRFGSGEAGSLVVICRGASLPATPVFSNRNIAGIGSQGRQGVYCEDFGRVPGASKAYLPMGDITKVACGAGGTAPSEDPDAGTGAVIEAGNLQSNLSVYAPITLFDNHHIWLDAAAHTITYKTQNTFTSGITAEKLKLTANYVGTDDIRVEVHDDPALAIRTDAADWTKTIAVTLNPHAAGWVTLRLELMQYESGKVVYVWPTPAIT